MDIAHIWKFVLDNIYVVAVAFISGGMLLWPMVSRSGGGPSVDTLRATLLMNQQDATLVDVREADEFAAGHIINARHIPLSQVESRAGEVKKNKSRPVIVYCATGTRSGAAVTALKKSGYEQVFNLAGGIAAWKQAGLPTEK
ncbi:MAG: rhodanese-like domain-containing protein [Betaproteobacteria bacterium]|nr:rhodanese-like domain-containing protein [Betaproteobacteria bacterium]